MSLRRQTLVNYAIPSRKEKCRGTTYIRSEGDRKAEDKKTKQMRCDRQYCAHRARILDQQKEGRRPAPLQTSLCSRWRLLVRHEICPTRHPRRTLPGKKSIRVSKHADLGSKGAPLRECHKVCRTRDDCNSREPATKQRKALRIVLGFELNFISPLLILCIC